MSSRNQLKTILLTVAMITCIAVIGWWRGLDTVFPALYRHTASLGIALSQARHLSSGFVGLSDIADVLTAHGYALYPDTPRLLTLAKDPVEADAALKAALAIDITHPGNTFILFTNETGMIDYYLLAFKIFGYHIRAFFWLYVALIVTISACFLVCFGRNPVFVAPSLAYLALLIAYLLVLDPENLQVGTPTNARILPVLMIYPVLFCLTAVAARLRFRARHVTAVVVAAMVYELWSIRVPTVSGSSARSSV